MTLAAAQHRDLLRLMDHFRLILNTAAEERPSRREIVDTDDGREIAWVIYERHTMHSAVNEVRARNGLPAVPLDTVKRVEAMACGHIDYVKKFALYCAELASPAIQADKERG